MAVVRKKPSKVDRKTAEAWRARGLSYEQTARKMDASTSAVYYALNRRPASPRVFASGRQRSLYLTDEIWEWLTVEAGRRGVSRSRLAGSILESERTFTANQEAIRSDEAG